MVLIRENKYFISEVISLKDFLASSCIFINFTKYSFLIENNLLLLNNSPLTSLNTTLVKGDSLILLTPKYLEPVVNEDYKIIFEDDFLLVVNKPAMLPVHPAGKYYFNTLTSLILRNENILFEGHVLTNLFPVNRLDRETSGLVVFAKSSSLAAKLQTIFSSKNTLKKYLAIVFGKTPSSWTINKPLVRKQFGNIRDHMSVDTSGLPSKTSFKTLKSFDNFSLIQAILHSGRRHQIRAHLSFNQTPIVGDKQYGLHPELFVNFVSNSSLVSDIECILLVGSVRQLLHCSNISFSHPVSGELLNFVSSLPEDFNYFLNKFK